MKRNAYICVFCVLLSGFLSWNLPISLIPVWRDSGDLSSALMSDVQCSPDVNLPLKTKSSVINGVSYLGCLDPHNNYSVISFTIENSDIKVALNYAFNAPLTALAWKRLGYNTIVLIAVSSDGKWRENEFLLEIIKKLLETDSFVLFLHCKLEEIVTISQSGRIIVPSIVNKLRGEAMKDVYIVTSDVDLWPLSNNVLGLGRGKKILSSNAFCCGFFSENNKKYRMLPMSSIGMTVFTWNEVIATTVKHPPINSSSLMDLLSMEFGAWVHETVKKGVNKNWFKDQYLISVLIQNWVNVHGNSSVDYIPRNTRKDRLDRAAWNLRLESLRGLNDTHVLLHGYQQSIWNLKLMPILKLMYFSQPEKLTWCQKYFEDFRFVLKEKQLN